MRIVNREVDFEEQMERAVSEATSAFGDGSVFIEKFITAPKHIKIQILGDQHGNYVYLFEREEAIARMIRAIGEYQISGVATTLPFCRFVLQHPNFVLGDFTTNL